jgi:hypothetical protein
LGDLVEGGKPIFEENNQIIIPCSWNECLNGHRWKPTVAIATCPGCGSPALMVKMENCPTCNEPVENFSLRSDHVPMGAGIAPRCKKVLPYGETMDIGLKRGHFEEVEGKVDKIEKI